MADLETSMDELGRSIERVKKERDALLGALVPFIEAYKRSLNPGVSDLDDEQPHHVTVALGDCRKAHIVYLDIIRAAQLRP